LKETIKVQEADLDKFEEEILTLRKDVELKTKQLAQGSTGGTGGNSAELTTLRQKNAELEKAARVLADQVTQLCDKAEKVHELEETVNKLDGENEQLSNDIKAIEAELDAREAEVENVLSDNDQLVLKLESLGIKVEFTSKGIAFQETDGKSSRPAASAQATAKAVSAAAPKTGSALSPPQGRARAPSNSKAEEAAAKGDMKELMSLSVDDLLG